MAPLVGHPILRVSEVLFPGAIDRLTEEPARLYCRMLVPERETFRRALLRLGVDTQRDDMTNCGGLNFRWRIT